MEHFLFIILFQILCDDRNLWTFLGTKLMFFIFLVLFIALFSIITLVLDSGVHGYFVLVFIPKFLVSVTFARLTKSAQLLFCLDR